MSSHSGNRTVIVGAGPSGLTAALTLARYRHPVTLVDSMAVPRNGVAGGGVHGHIGLDGVPATEIRSRAWKELSEYQTVELVEAGALEVRAEPNSEAPAFTVALDDGRSLEAATVMLATGVRDIHPEIGGFDDCWGRTVIHCPLCLGEENAGRTWGHVTENAQIAGLSAAALRAWSDDVMLICPESMDGLDQVRATAQGLGVGLETGNISHLHHQNGQLQAVEFDDGRLVERQTLVWTPAQQHVPVINSAIGHLGLDAGDAGFVKVDERQRTSVPGVFAVGDLTSRWNQSFTLATSTGVTAAETIHATFVFASLGVPMPAAPDYGD